jgi:hypothetical protein
MELDARSDARRDRGAVSERRRECPSQRRRASRLSERFDALDDADARDGAIGLDDQLQLDDGVPLGASRVRNIRADLRRRRSDHRRILGDR